MATAAIKFNATLGSVETLGIGTVCTLSNNDDTGVVSWLWEILDKPDGSATVISDDDIASPTFTPDKLGTYRIRLTVNAGESTDTKGGAVLTTNTPARLIAYQETTDYGSRGWASSENKSIRRTNLTSGYGKIVVGVNVTGGSLAVGKAVYIGTLASDYGAFSAYHPGVLLAANSVGTQDSEIGIVIGSIDDDGATAAGDYCRVCLGGIVTNTTVTNYAAPGDPVGLSSTLGQVIVGGSRTFGYALSATKVWVRVDSRIVTVSTATEIYNALEDDYVYEVIIPTGTYDFNGITTDLTLYSNKKVRFIGDVVFKNVRIGTGTYTSGNCYYDAASSIAWNAGTGKFDKTGGANWAATTSWMIFARDAWYEIASADATHIEPTIDFHGNTLTGDSAYILCEPTVGLVIEGSLKLIVDDSPAPAALYLISAWVNLYGLCRCNLSKFRLEITRDSDTALTSTGNIGAVEIAFCGASLLPEICVSNFNCAPGSATSFFAFYFGFCIQVYSEGMYVQNMVLDTASSGYLCGFRLLRVKSSRISRAIASGLSRKSGGAGDHVYGMRIDSVCYDNFIDFLALNLYSSAGSAYENDNSGTRCLVNISSSSNTPATAVNTNLIPDGNATRDLGTASYYWDDVYFDSINTNNLVTYSSAKTLTRSINGSAVIPQTGNWTVGTLSSSSSTTSGVAYFHFDDIPVGAIIASVGIDWARSVDTDSVKAELYIQLVDGSDSGSQKGSDVTFTAAQTSRRVNSTADCAYTVPSACGVTVVVTNGTGTITIYGIYVTYTQTSSTL